jgi:hypothetical protein
MKKLFVILAIFVLPLWACAQDFIDDVFNKYSGKDGFTSIVISNELLNFAFALDWGNGNEKDSEKNIDVRKGKVTDLKILVSKRHNDEERIDFISAIKGSFNKNSYLSLMEILDGKNKVNIYAKKDADKIVHLLLLATDDGEQVLLSLKGNFTLKDLVELGKNCNDNESFHDLTYLKSLEK